MRLHRSRRRDRDLTVGRPTLPGLATSWQRGLDNQYDYVDSGPRHTYDYVVRLVACSVSR